MVATKALTPPMPVGSQRSAQVSTFVEYGDKLRSTLWHAAMYLMAIGIARFKLADHPDTDLGTVDEEMWHAAERATCDDLSDRRLHLHAGCGDLLGREAAAQNDPLTGVIHAANAAAGRSAVEGAGDWHTSAVEAAQTALMALRRWDEETRWEPTGWDELRRVVRAGSTPRQVSRIARSLFRRLSARGLTLGLFRRLRAEVGLEVERTTSYMRPGDGVRIDPNCPFYRSAVEALRRIGRPLSQLDLLHAMSYRANGNDKSNLALLVSLGLLRSDHRRGYGLPEWDVTK